MRKIFITFFFVTFFKSFLLNSAMPPTPDVAPPLVQVVPSAQTDLLEALEIIHKFQNSMIKSFTKLDINGKYKILEKKRMNRILAYFFDSMDEKQRYELLDLAMKNNNTALASKIRSYNSNPVAFKLPRKS